jgi:hypothetical protein
MYIRIIISNFPGNLIIISQFHSFFSLFFQFFKFWSFLGHFFIPQTPGVPKLFGYGARFIPGAPEMSASLKKLLHDTFFPCQLCKNPDMVIFTILGHFGGPLGRWALTWGLPRRLHMVPNFSLLAHTSFLYNWIIFRHKSSYKRRKISCSVKIILKTSILSDFDHFMGSQHFLCTHKSQILFTNVQ